MMIDIDTLLAWGACYKKVAENEIIFQEGQQAHFYQQLVSGSIRWVSIYEDGREFIQNIIEPGECFGELPLFDGEPFAATAIANKDSLILRLHVATFHQLLKENPNIHFAFSKLLTERLRYKFLILKEMANHNPEQCITTLLNYLKTHKKNICSSCNMIKLTRQQIANMTGLRVETVIRTIRHLHERGELLIEKGKVFYN